MKDKKVSLINYGINNLKSVEMALQYLGYKVNITSDKNELLNSDKIILPGVGSFANGMKELRKIGVIDTLIKCFVNKIDILGICLGMQMLLEESEEFGKHKGLGLIEGSVKKIPHDNYVRKIPHIGWNTITFNKEIDVNNIKPLFISTNEKIKNSYYYFIHSFVAIPIYDNNILAYTEYENFKFTSAVIKDNLFGVQFHPERSDKQGLDLLNNFLNQ